MKRIILLLLAGCMITTTYAQDEVKTKTSYSVSGGLLGALNLTKFRITGNNAPNNIDYDTKAGWSAGGWVNFPISSSFSIEPQVMYSSHRYFTDSVNNTTLLLNDGKISYISLPVLLKIGGEKFAATFGPQFDFFMSVDDNNNRAVDADFNKTSISLSGGVEVFPHGKVTIFGRYIHGLSNMDARSGHSDAMAFKNSNIQFGLKLRLFGGKKETETFKATSEVPVIPDTDGDGIKDDVDKCPTVAGIAKYDGCPIPDSDGDGINDEEDKCPNVAGLAKYQGCPIPDSDGDGINDEEDKCPTVAGVAKYEGCPIPDKDGDGINDDEDRCPDIAGVATNNGCPEVPANVTKTLAIAAQGVAFGTGTKNLTLTTKSNTALDQVVKVMNENPGLRLKIEAHTDNAGDDDANMKLTEDRATAVKDYIVSKGISADRITTEGFGETMPIADNSTSAGRAKNRRIEIKMLD